MGIAGREACRYNIIMEIESTKDISPEYAAYLELCRIAGREPLITLKNLDAEKLRRAVEMLNQAIDAEK